MQIHAKGTDSWSILHRSFHPCRKRPHADLLTGGALHLLHPMVSHHQMERRQVMYLPVFLHFPWNPLERLLTVLASKRTMAYYLVWRGDRKQGMSSMPHLSA